MVAVVAGVDVVVVVSGVDTQDTLLRFKPFHPHECDFESLLLWPSPTG